jgi:hypothetical protein
MAITYLLFSSQFPELTTVPNAITQTVFDSLLASWLAELGSYKGKVCLPEGFTAESGVTEAQVQDQLRYLWLAHNIVASNIGGAYEGFLMENVKQVESLDNRLEFAYDKSSSRFDYNLTSYGKRYLDMLKQYSCVLQAEELRQGIHEISGISGELEDCCDGYASETGYEDFFVW